MNAQPPTPKAEVVVTRYGDRSIRISAITPDTQQWIKQHLAAYGRLAQMARQSHFDLDVLPNYDADDVARYIVESCGGIVEHELSAVPLPPVAEPTP